MVVSRTFVEGCLLTDESFLKSLSNLYFSMKKLFVYADQPKKEGLFRVHSANKNSQTRTPRKLRRISRKFVQTIFSARDFAQILCENSRSHLKNR